MFKRISIDVTIWLALWSGLWGIFYVLLGRGINYITHPAPTAAYFFLSACLVCVIYRGLLKPSGRGLTAVSFSVLGLSLALGAGIYLCVPALLAPPRAVIVENPEMFFLSFDVGYLLAKPFDILFQQALIFTLVRLLVLRGLPLKQVSILCALLFGFAHLYLLKGEGYILGSYFVVFSTLAGLIFPYLIERLRNGVLYCYSLHWTFYIVTGTACWLCPSAFSR